ncbi:hypothetical protein LTR09_005842 [Extremus antarcticus]|uniref:SCP domain-containing protein n=1 Tax=Extremus antarcticus TaxID=702011 RepID=A0AAJ0DFW7_9PEZI|nr:hypothetical protein LTR09_005842 [Extremus antarcticus]
MLKNLTILTALLATSQAVLAVPASPELYKEKRDVVVVTKVETVVKYAHPTANANPNNAPGWFKNPFGGNKPAGPQKGYPLQNNPHPTQGDGKDKPKPKPVKRPIDNMNAPGGYQSPSPSPGAGNGNGGNATPKPSPSSKPQPGYPNPPKPGTFNYKNTVLHHHNIHRANHSAPALTWSADLASTAAKIASSCIYGHNTAVDGGGYGQNIAAGTPPNHISDVITNMFYNHEEPYYAGNYGKAKPDMADFEHWGHFSQVVWKKTEAVGCHTQDCSKGGLQGVGQGVGAWFTVCNYKSPGNFAGQYGENVGRPLRRATVYGVSGK